MLLLCHKLLRGCRSFSAFVFLIAISAILVSAGCSKPSLIAKNEQPDEVAIDRILDRYQPIDIVYDSFHLSNQKKQIIRTLIDAGEFLDEIFWQQSAHNARAWRDRLQASDNSFDKKIYRLLSINAGPFDRLNQFKSFLGEGRKPLGAGYYPADLTKEELEHYIKQFPAAADELLSPYSLIERKGDTLIGVPYRKAYRSLLQPAAALLKQAAELSDNASLKRFLTLRSEALLSDNFVASDIAWIDLESDIEVIFGPYEVYEDGLMATKTAYEAVVAVRDQKATKSLQRFQRILPQFEVVLPYSKQAKRQKRAGASTPLVVVNDLYRSGDARAGYQFVAVTLPNDPAIRAKKGSKKVMVRNMMSARVKTVIRPLAERLIVDEQVAMVRPDAFFSFVLLHEVSHALGPQTVIRSGRRIPINRYLNEYYSGLEEAKADIVSLFCHKYLFDKEWLSEANLKKVYVSTLASFFRTMRFGIANAHGQAAITIFNYLSEQGAIVREQESGRYRIAFQEMPTAVERLAANILTIQETADYQAAKKFMQRYGSVSEQLRADLQRSESVPVDFVPTFVRKGL